MWKKWFGDADFWRSALRLALPIAVQNLLMSSFALVDTMMIGSLGKVAVAAVGGAGQLSWLMNIVIFGFTSGASVFISQFWGNKDMVGIRHTYGLLLLNISLGALAFTLVGLWAPRWFLSLYTKDAAVIEEGVRYLRVACFSYLAVALNQAAGTVLRATEHVKLPLYISVVSVISNAALNALFIFGLKMGVTGAALATTLSAWISPIALYGISLAKRNVLIAPPAQMFSWQPAFVKKFFLISLPVLFNESMWALGTTGYNMLYGQLSTDFFAALTIFRSVEGLFFAFFVGLCHASTVLVGKSVGAGDYPQAIQDARRFSALVVSLSVLAGLLLIAIRTPLLSLFDVGAEVNGYARAIMLVYGLELGLRNIPYIQIVGVFRAGGDTKTGLLYDLLCVWGIALPLTCFCALVLKWPLIWVYLVMLLSEDVVKSLLCVRRFITRKWIKPVTHPGGGAGQTA